MERPTAADRAAVAALLGREPEGDFEVVVRHADGGPLVIRNAPVLPSGRPMPTRYWLVGEPERTWVGRLESAGGVDRAEAEVDPEDLAAAHARAASERDAALPPGHEGPRPSGGVAGTRTGVKCLHAHYASWLAGLDDPVGAWVAAHLPEVGGVAPARDVAGRPASRQTGPVSSVAGPVAAIDCGTNSTRLLVAEPDGGGGLRTLTRLMRITRLGAGVDRTRALDDDAVARTQAVLAEYRSVMDDHGVPAGNVRISATSAARDATNRDAWFDAAEAVVGARPELLSGDEEAALSFRGATTGLDPADGPFLVFDLGGGSTELALGTSEVTESISLEIGCVRLTERFIESDPPRPEELTAAITYAASWLDDVLRKMPGVGSARTVVGLAGTVSTVAAVEIGLDAYDRSQLHGFTLTKDAVEDVFRTLATESRADRVHNPGLEEGRADVIVGGCCALVALYRTLGLDEVRVSEADILDGLALSVLDRVGQA